MKRQAKSNLEKTNQIFIYVKILFLWEKDVMKNKFNQISNEITWNCVVKNISLRKNVN